MTENSAPEKLRTDFGAGRFGYRAARFGRNEPLLRAVGAFKTGAIHIVDATAGLGQDGFLLASAGAQVTLIERSAVIHAALLQSLAAARLDDNIAETVARMTVLHGDARLLLPTLRADVFYIDPMHPERKKSALVKEPMRLLRDVVGDDKDSGALIRTALNCNPGRIVVKWPAKAPLPDGISVPSYELRARTTRYCVFVSGAHHHNDAGFDLSAIDAGG